jgi:predicted lactoylglutathione lyase
MAKLIFINLPVSDLACATAQPGYHGIAGSPS